MNRILIVTILILLGSWGTRAGSTELLRKKEKEKKEQKVDSLKIGIDFLKRYLSEKEGWYVPGKNLKQSMQGIVSHFESGPLDSLINKIDYYRQFDNLLWVDRRPEDIPMPDSISGVVSNVELEETLMRIDRNVKTSFFDSIIVVPPVLFADIEQKIDIIEEGEEEHIFADGKRAMPDSISINVHDTIWNKMSDSLRQETFANARKSYLDSIRREYNDSLIYAYRDSVSADYRTKYVQLFSDSIQRYYSDSIRLNNITRIKEWNDSVVHITNQRIAGLLGYLSNKAINDSVDVNVLDIDGNPLTLRLKNNDPYYMRVWMKNQQRDSLSVRIENINRRTMRMYIDDGVSFNRFTVAEKKDYIFDYKKPSKKINKVSKKVDVYGPWTLSGDGTVGFTQTHVGDYWKKGGNSSMSILFVLKGKALYKKNKINWATNGELRNGWARLGGDNVENKLRKSSDKLYVASRLGVSAFKKWFYSAEASFETQLFNGYKYSSPKKQISAFMAPGTFKFKLGMDYKPHKNMSVFVSPITMKTVWVLSDDVDKSSYGINKESSKKKFTVPGLNFDLSWKKEVTDDITYRTKVRAFFDYTNPFKKKDIWWENNIVMQLTQRMNMRLETYLKYYQNEKFDEKYTNAEGEEATRKVAKWQFKELFNIGFSYKINKRVYKRKVKIPM
ncbi:DUF3078 domain-containing protein [Prolixibacteraceae bacterium JC049]|nr:DUF3078 domain-containing protein [Prolixibacteraceae bacterium JC049]